MKYPKPRFPAIFSLIKYTIWNSKKSIRKPKIQFKKPKNSILWGFSGPIWPKNRVKKSLSLSSSQLYTPMVSLYVAHPKSNEAPLQRHVWNIIFLDQASYPQEEQGSYLQNSRRFFLPKLKYFFSKTAPNQLKLNKFSITQLILAQNSRKFAQNSIFQKILNCWRKFQKKPYLSIYAIYIWFNVAHKKSNEVPL